MTNANALSIQERLRGAFDADDVAEKNLALRAGYDHIDALEKALREIDRGNYDGLEVANLTAAQCRRIARAALGE